MKQAPELTDEVQLLKERVRDLEWRSRRPAVVYIDNDDIIDGSCSCKFRALAPE